MSRTPGERKDLNFSVKMSPLDLSYLESVKEELRVNSMAEIVRDFIDSMRSLFRLPPYMADRVRKDMKERGITSSAYIQELLGRRYEELARADAAAEADRSSAARAGSKR